MIIDEDNPDIVFHSCFGKKITNCQKGIKVFYTGENILPDYTTCDYSISFVRSDDKNLYLPLSIIDYKCHSIIPSEKEVLDRKFCNFVYNQQGHYTGYRLRKIICELLMKYKHVDCPAKVMNNMTSPKLANRYDKNWQQSKVEFLRDYKFTIAIENNNFDGYMTEKLLHPLMAGSVPIYWGSAGNTTPFSKDCMICVNDFDEFNDLLEYVKYVDNNDEEYLKLWSNNPLIKGTLPSYKQLFLDFIEKILDKGEKMCIIKP